MTVTQEMVNVLFEKDTIIKVKEQFSSNKEIVPIESRDMSFRLFKTNHGNINLELLATDNNGMYFKVIGYYDGFEKGGFFSSDKLSINILKEFEEDFKSLKNLNTQNINVKFMNTLQSGLIGAFSRETIHEVNLMYTQKEKGISKEMAEQIGQFPHIHAMQFDKSLTSNGLQIDLLFSTDGFPQCYLDDDYNIEGAFGAYFKNENGLSLNPTGDHKNNFDKFHKMGLLSAFKSI